MHTEVEAEGVDATASSTGEESSDSTLTLTSSEPFSYVQSLFPEMQNVHKAYSILQPD